MNIKKIGLILCILFCNSLFAGGYVEESRKEEVIEQASKTKIEDLSFESGDDTISFLKTIFLNNDAYLLEYPIGLNLYNFSYINRFYGEGASNNLFIVITLDEDSFYFVHLLANEKRERVNYYEDCIENLPAYKEGISFGLCKTISIDTLKKELKVLNMNWYQLKYDIFNIFIAGGQPRYLKYNNKYFKIDISTEGKNDIYWNKYYSILDQNRLIQTYELFGF